MRMLKIAALAAATFGLALPTLAQQPTGQGMQMCQQIWQQADAQNQGFVTGQEAQRMNQAIQTAQAPSGMGGTGGGAAGGTPGTKTPGMTNGMKGGGAAQRVTREEFMSACQRSPQTFQHLRS